MECVLEPFFKSIPLQISGQDISKWMLARLKTCFIRSFAKEYPENWYKKVATFIQNGDLRLSKQQFLFDYIISQS